MLGEVREISGEIKLQQTFTNYHILLLSRIYFSTQLGAWHQLSKGTPPTTSSQSLLPSSFSHYADLFMNTAGSGDHIPFTTSGLDFQCSTSTVSLNCVTWMSGQIALRFESWGRFLCVYAHIRGGFHAKSYSCIRANDAISWYFLKANTPPPPPSLSPSLSFSLRFTPLPSLIHCSYWRQDMLASMLPALTESFFFFSFGS